MKKILLFLVVMLASVMPAMADYTLQFVESSSSSDSTTPYGDDVPSVFLSEGTSVVASVTSNKKVYPGKTGYGAKFGSSTTAGEMTIGLHQLFAEARIKVAPYSSTGSVMVKLNEAEYEVSKSADGDFVEIFYAPEAGFTTLTITSTAATNARFYVKSITLSETASGPNGGGTGALRGNAVWPIFMDGITRQQESSKIVADFTNDEQERNFYIWNNTYQGENVYGGNFYDNGDVYMSLTVQNEGWSGFGMNILAGNNSWDAAVNLWQNIHSNPEKYYLHLALKSTDYASHDFYVFDDLTTRFTIGTSPQDSSSVIIGDFARDGEWHEFDIPMSMFAMSPDFTSTDGMNIFVALSGGVTGTQLNLDAVYFYEVSDSQTDKGEGDVPPVTGEYTLKFVESGSQTDISQTYANNVDAIFQNGAGVVADVTSVNAVFAARTGWGAKFGSNSKIGELTVSLENSSYVGAKLMVMPYMSGSSSLISVNGTELETPVVNDSSFVEVVYTSNEILTSLEIKGVPTSASSTISPRSRFYLQSITLLQTEDAGNQGSGTSDPCVIKSFPWEENFDAAPITADEVIPTCWDNSMDSESTAAFNKWSYYTSENLNSQCVRFDSYNNQRGEWNILKTPTMTLPQGMALFVKYKNPSGGDFNIYMYGADSATTTLKSGLVDVANWRVEKIDLSQYAGQMVSFGFEGVSNWGNGDAYIYIDKVAVMSNTQELDTESDPDFGPQIIIEEYQTLQVDQAHVGRVEPGWYDVMVMNMKTLPTVTSMNPDLLRIDSVRFVDGAGEAVSNPADAVSLRIHYVTTPTTLGYLEGSIDIVAGQTTATLPFAMNVTEVYELVPLNAEEALHLTAAPGEMLTFTLKFTHTGFTPDQVSAGFPYGVSTEGYELGQLYLLNDTVMALDVHISGRKNGVYSTEVMLEAHAGVCFSDVTAYVRFETKISDSWIQKLTKEINFGVLPLNSGVYADTVYLKYHNVNLDSVVVGVNILPYDGEPYIPCGVGDVVVLNDSMMSVLVECNTNIVEVGPGSYSLRFYYVVYDDNVVTDEDTDIPVKMTFVAPEIKGDSVLDYGTMLFDEYKTLTLQFQTRYCEKNDISIVPSSEVVTVGELTMVDTLSSSEWKSYEVKVTLNAYGLYDFEKYVTVRVGTIEHRVTLHAYVPEPTITLTMTSYDFGKVPLHGGDVWVDIPVAYQNAVPDRIGYNIINAVEGDTTYVPLGFGETEIQASNSMIIIKMALTPNNISLGIHDYQFYVVYAQNTYYVPVTVTIVPEAQIEIVPEVIDFGDVPFSSLVNDYISTEVKIATTSVHQAVASIEGDSAFSLSQFTFGPTESYFGNRLEQDLTIYALPNRMGQHMAELKLNGDSGKTVVVAQVMMNVVPREVLYDTIRATICDNETYPFDGKMLNVAGTYSETTKTIYGGDSITTLILTVLPTLYGDAYASIRDYEYYVFHGDTIREAGDFRYPLSKASSIGCDSVVTLHLTVLETMYRTEDATICSNQSYIFYGEKYSQAGQYTHRIENTQLGDSVITLNLIVLPTSKGEEFATIRDYEFYFYEGDSLSKAGDYEYTLTAINGCDSTVTLHLTVLETMYRTENATICSNSSYTFYGDAYTEAGTYTHRIENTQLGDSVITLNLTVLPTKTGEDFATIRDYEVYYYENDSLTQAGDYTYTLVAENGCDSTVTLHLTVLETMYRTEEATICANESYTFYGDAYTEAGTYEHRIENEQLGDSVITLNLTVLPTKMGEESATIRDYEWYHFPAGSGRDSTNVAGDYTYTLVAANGCDSTVTLHLTVLETMYRTEEATICSNQSYTFYGEKYSQAGQYTHRIENTLTGDSVITLNLTVLPTKTGEAFATIRDYEFYFYEGDTLTKAGNYEYTLVAANGCDSTVTLHLTVLETMYRTEEATICSNQSYTFYGEKYSQAGQYTHRIENTLTGDSVITLNLTVLPTKTGEDFATIRDYEFYYYEGDTLSKAGDYEYTLTAINGCDSTVTLNLTVLETMYRTEDATICANQSYTFYGQEYAKAGKYEHRIENEQLGDSVITLNLTVLPTKTGEDFATIRDYEWYYFPAESDREDSTDVAGDYTYTLTASNGCDSTVTLHLTVLETMYRTEDATICSNSSYTFYDQVYTEAGKYEHRIENTQLGDSVITLNLTVLPTKTGEEFATIRDYEWYYFPAESDREDSTDVAGDYTYTLTAINGCDSTVALHLTVLETMYRTEEATICANQSYTFYGEVYSQAGQYEHRIENEQLGDSVITLNLTVLPTSKGEDFATIRDYEWYYFPAESDREDSTDVAGDYTYTLVAANGCDSVVTLHLTVVPSCSEYVVVNAPDEVVYYGDSTEFAPVVELICPSRDAVIEWGRVMNYNPNADGKVDVTNPVEYVELQFEPMANYSGDTLSSRFNNYILDRTQYFYYQIWQCDTVKEMHLFRFEHVGQVNSIWVNYDAPKRDQLISSDATISVDGGEAKTVMVAWYNTQDTVNVATGNFVHGQTYYAVVTTPMTEILGENYHIDATTTIVWGEEQQPKALTNGQLQSPMYTMENVTWTFRLEDAMLAPDGQASINACAEPSVLISGSNSVVLNWELSTDNQNWLTLTDTLGYNIDVDSYCTDIHFPATLLRAGTYYIRVRAQYQGETFYSRTAELVIQAGIVMAEEAVQQTTVTETGEEVAAVQYMFDEQENVGVLTLTNSTNEGSATTAVAITSNTVVEIVGTNTVVSDEAGFESSGDLEFVGRIDSTQVDEEGNTIYVAMDSMSIVSRRPLYAPGQGVKVTFNGVYMVLAVYGHEDDNLIPSRSAARAQQKRAYRIAHAALEAAGEESVISGFDEADFINCGIIEPEGAEYDGENNELMNDGDPVYNCTIVPIIIPEDPMSTGMVKDVVRAEKRIVNDVIYIFRQGKTYTMMGQTVE